MKRWCFSYAIKIFFCIVIAGLALGALTMYLWNWLIPAIFNGPAITFIQALGILIFSKVLFGFRGWKGRGCCSNSHFGHGEHGGYKGYWRKRWEAKFANMSPEEKEKFKEKYKGCCNFGHEEESKNNTK